MKRILLLLVLAGLLLPLAHAARAADTQAEFAEFPQTPLRFWGIGISEFYADKPRAVSIPDTEGELNYYWYWTFKFRVKTNLEKYDAYISEKLDNGDITDPKLREYLPKYQQKIRETLEQAKHLPLYMVTHTGQGQILPNTSNTIVRNMIERSEGRRLQTVKEISEMNLHDVEKTRDIDHGVGKWVYGVATFDPLEPKTRFFEVRVYGMGRRIVPNYEPGALMFPIESMHRDNALNPSLRRCFRYFYHRIGQSGFPQLNTVQFEGREGAWVWVWPPQIYLGKYRVIEIERRSGLGLKRRYFFAPYRLWNNTTEEQEIAVVKSGFMQAINWKGESIKLTMYDIGEAQGLWKTQVMRAIRQRVEDGTTLSFAKANETYTIESDRAALESEYRKWKPSPLLMSGGTTPNYDTQVIEYIPTDPHEADAAKLETSLGNNELLAKFLEEWNARRDADAEAKADILPTDEEDRQYKGNIPPGKFVRGLIIVRFGVTDLDAVVTDLIYSLKAQALSGAPAEDKPLLQAYLAMRPKNKYPERSWLQPPEPSDDEVRVMLIKMANEELANIGGTVTDEDTNRYGELAPIGAWLNHLAEKYMQDRADKGLIDTFFEVKIDGVNDRTMLVSHFKRIFPKPRDVPRRFTSELDKLLPENQKKRIEEAKAREEGEDEGSDSTQDFDVF